MKNLGEKLLAARNAKGLSIRDVADSTRLRIDVIEKMEAGRFDAIKLQEIYKRGFIKIYGAFLRLDTNALLAEYEEIMSMRRGESHRRHLIRNATNVVSNTEAEPPKPVVERYDVEEESENEEVEDFPSKYLKLGGVFVAVLLAAILIVFIVSSLVRSAPEENPEVSTMANAPVATSNVAAPSEMLVAISAKADTYISVSYPNDEKNALYAGSITAGQTKEIKCTSSVVIYTTDAQHIEISRNGVKLDLAKANKGVAPTGVNKFGVSLK